MIRLAVRVAREGRPRSARGAARSSRPPASRNVDGEDGSVEYVLYGAPGELPSLPALQASVGDALVEVSTSEIADDWATRWRSFHRPVTIAATLHVRPPWHDAAPASEGLIDIVIDPGQAFGTGSHATTQLCLELLVELARAGAASGPLLDLGCGSGVLAIAAAKLGFDPVIAIDHEAESVLAAHDNALANGVELDVRRGDLTLDELPHAPTVAANLLQAAAARPRRAHARAARRADRLRAPDRAGRRGRRRPSASATACASAPGARRASGPRCCSRAPARARILSFGHEHHR